MKLYKIGVIVGCLLLAGGSIKAQSVEDKALQELRADSSARTRFITRATMYGVGFTNVFDTYLSPQEYKGVDFRISRESMRMTKWMNGNVSLQSFFQADLGYTHNRVDNNNTFSGLANWNYGLHYNFPITSNFKLLAGGLIDLNGGFVYNLRNGNNPAQARAYINLDASGMAIWDLRIKNYPISLRYQVNLPFAGIMFSPNYGQSYYEIFTLGNWNGVINFTSLHNQPSLRQMLTVDFPVGRAKMRLAYLWDAQHPIVTHEPQRFSGGLLLGFLLAAAPARTDDIGMQADLHLEHLVVIRPRLALQDIVQPFLRIVLDNLLKGGLVVLEMAAALVGRLLLQIGQDKRPHRLQPAVEINCGDHRLEGVGQDGGAFSPP